MQASAAAGPGPAVQGCHAGQGDAGTDAACVPPATSPGAAPAAGGLGSQPDILTESVRTVSPSPASNVPLHAFDGRVVEVGHDRPLGRGRLAFLRKHSTSWSFSVADGPPPPHRDCRQRRQGQTRQGKGTAVTEVLDPRSRFGEGSRRESAPTPRYDTWTTHRPRRFAGSAQQSRCWCSSVVFCASSASAVAMLYPSVRH